MSSVSGSSNNSDEQLKRALKNEAGAISPKVIWGALGLGAVLCLGVIVIVNTAATPAVMPVEQSASPNEQQRYSPVEDENDEEAKQTLDAIAAAESAYVGLTADTGKVTFGSMEDLQKSKLLDPAKDRVAANQSRAIESGEGTTAHFGASSISTSGKVFYIGDRETKPVEVITFDPADTTTELKLKATAEAGLTGNLDGDFTN